MKSPQECKSKREFILNHPFVSVYVDGIYAREVSSKKENQSVTLEFKDEISLKGFAFRIMETSLIDSYTTGHHLRLNLDTKLRP